MNTFSATVTSTADISASRSDVWDVLTDPALIAKLTPLLQSIDADGDTWRWHMTKISALGVSIVPAFTEHLLFKDQERIEYTHTPPKGVTERAGAEGIYELSDVEGGTRLAISLTLNVELPLPKATSRAVQKIMLSTMNRTGDKFAANLLAHLGAHEL